MRSRISLIAILVMAVAALGAMPAVAKRHKKKPKPKPASVNVIAPHTVPLKSTLSVTVSGYFNYNKKKPGKTANSADVKQIAGGAACKPSTTGTVLGRIGPVSKSGKFSESFKAKENVKGHYAICAILSSSTGRVIKSELKPFTVK